MFSLLTASTPIIITFNTQKDFEKGKPNGVSISNRGEIYLAPKIEAVFKPDIPFIWAGVADSRGNIFAAGGNNGQVFKIDPDNQSSVVFESEDLQIYAMAVDKQNNLYIGTSPQGKIYKILNGRKTNSEEAVFFAPGQVYIWSIAVDDQNNIYVATGDKGNIYRVDQQGNGTLFYESQDVHIRKIVLDAQGNIIAGTANKGMIIRIDSNGQAFVLYDSPLVEITDIEIDGTGNIFAAAAGESRLKREIPRTPATAQSVGENTQVSTAEEDRIDLPVQQISAEGPPRFGQQNSALYRIEKDGTVKTIWSSRKYGIYAIILDDDENIVLGTGEPGRLFSLKDAREHTLLTELEETQITVLGKDSGRKKFICTSNTGRIYRLSSEHISQGDYISEVIDASVSSQWGALSWEAEIPESTKLVFYSRTGNTEEPDKTWSSWSESYTNSSGQLISSPHARFIQLKASLTTTNSRYSPVLEEVSFSYLQKNIEPEINDILVHAPGNYFPNFSNQMAVDSHIESASSSNNNNTQNQSTGRKTFRQGFRSISWKTKDDNGDQLSFDLFYKGEDENSWKTLVKDFQGFVYSWDSELFPDGKYFIKIIAKDDQSNPPSMALSSDKISPLFKVDNSGPKISDIKIQAQKNDAKISFVVEDEMLNIKSVEYGLNADDWKLVYPVDGICDSKTEKFEIVLKSYVKGVNTIVIKAEDALGNTGFGKTNIKL